MAMKWTKIVEGDISTYPPLNSDSFVPIGNEIYMARWIVAKQWEFYFSDVGLDTKETFQVKYWMPMMELPNSENIKQ